MKAGASRHRFDDPQYEQQKASIAENLDDAIEEGTAQLLQFFLIIMFSSLMVFVIAFVC